MLDMTTSFNVSPVSLPSLCLCLTKSISPFSSAASASLLASVTLWFLVNRDYGVFVGLWVPSILILWVGVRVALLAKTISRSRRDVDV